MRKTSEEHKRKVENERLDRINIQRSHLDTITSLREIMGKDKLKANAVVGVCYELLVTSLLDGYQDISIEDLKSRYDLDDLTASIVKTISVSFRDGINGTRSAMIGGSDKKRPKTTKPSDNLPDALKGEEDY